MKNNEHLSNKGLNEILNMKASLNNGISENVLIHFPTIQKVPRTQVILPKSIDYN